MLSRLESCNRYRGLVERHGIILLHTYQERLTNYRVKYCDLLTGEMQDSGTERKPASTTSFVPTSFVLPPTPCFSLTSSPPPPHPFSSLPPPGSVCPSLIPLTPGPLSSADCPLFINAIKETECRASTVGFLLCRCRGPAARSTRELGNGRESILRERGTDEARKGRRCQIHTVDASLMYSSWECASIDIWNFYHAPTLLYDGCKLKVKNVLLPV